jgi:hypothetical protein
MSPRESDYLPGSGLLALMDKDGNVSIANDILNELDVSPIGLSSPTSDPIDEKGQIAVRLYGKQNSEKDGLYYMVDTTLGLKRLPYAPDPKDNLIIY